MKANRIDIEDLDPQSVNWMNKSLGYEQSNHMIGQKLNNKSIAQEKSDRMIGQKLDE